MFLLRLFIISIHFILAQSGWWTPLVGSGSVTGSFSLFNDSSHITGFCVTTDWYISSLKVRWSNGVWSNWWGVFYDYAPHHCYSLPSIYESFDGIRLTTTAENVIKSLSFRIKSSGAWTATYSGTKPTIYSFEFLSNSSMECIKSFNLRRGKGLTPVGGIQTYFAPQTTSTQKPTYAPTADTLIPTRAPSSQTMEPSIHPTDAPSTPTLVPSTAPTVSPTITTKSPTNDPSLSPSHAPTKSPSPDPTISPSVTPTLAPTRTPSANPSSAPTKSPTDHPSSPSMKPTLSPSKSPAKSPSQSPSTESPSKAPTKAPSDSPTTAAPTATPLDNLHLVIRYADKSWESFYKFSLYTTSDYTDIIKSGLDNAFKSVYGHGIMYSNDDNWNDKAWKRGGMINVEFCRFSDIEPVDDLCPLYVANTGEFIAVAVFDVSVNDGLTEYVRYLRQSVRNPNYYISLDEQMDLLNAQHFEVISIDIIDVIGDDIFDTATGGSNAVVYGVFMQTYLLLLIIFLYS